MISNFSHWVLRFAALLAAIVLLILVGMMAFNNNATANAFQQGTIIQFALPDEAYAGELITVKLVATNAQNLAGFQTTIQHDAANLQVGGATVEQGLKLGGRDVIPLDPIRGNGTLTMGAATCPVSNCSGSPYDTTTRNPQGVNGQVELVKLELIAPASGRYELTLQNVQLIDPQGNQLGFDISNAVLDVKTR